MESNTVKSAETETTTTITTTTTTTITTALAAAAVVARCAGRRHRCWNHRLPLNGTTAPSRAITVCMTWRSSGTSHRRPPNGTHRAHRRPAGRTNNTIPNNNTITSSSRRTIGTRHRRRRRVMAPQPEQEVAVAAAVAATTIFQYRRARLKASCHRRHRWPNGSTMPRVTTIVMPPPPNGTNPLIPGKQAPTIGDSASFSRVCASGHTTPHNITYY